MNGPERWVPIPGWEGLYEVSDLGRIRRAGRILRPWTQKGGHQVVGLSREGRRTDFLIHRLVLLAFVGVPATGQEACHADGDPAHNALANLRWDTRSANLLDRVRHGTDHNSAKTRCPQGHPYDAENTYSRPRGGRNCRACNRISRSKGKAAA